jgi:putative SOS response-associated peptidase YedK
VARAYDLSLELFTAYDRFALWHRGQGDAIPSFTILATTPNELAAQIHNRMSVILRSEHYERWLDPDVKDR